MSEVDWEPLPAKASCRRPGENVDVIVRQPFATPGLRMAAYGLAAIGMEGEMRRSGGYASG